MKVYSHSLQGKRESNEDQHVHILNLDGDDKTMNSINFLAVFDGHGGKSVSRYLKDNLPQFFTNKLKKNIFTKQEKITDYILKIYDMIQTKMKEHHPRAVQYCGSTACVAIQAKDKHNKNLLWIINVGDSRAVKCNKNDIAEQLSQDHKPNVPTEKKRIYDLGGKIEFDGVDWRVKDLSLSRAFGDVECTPYVTHLPQIYKYKISSSDKFIVLACDGLWDVLSNQDVVDYINTLKYNNYNGNYSKKLAEHALDKGSMDNISVIILFF